MLVYHKLTKHPDIAGCGETSEVDGFWGHPLDRQPSNRRCKEMGDIGILWSTFFIFEQEHKKLHFYYFIFPLYDKDICIIFLYFL